ncbi:hypothetical protein [Marinifilum fragile]|uniref:hypothetical protein n=1 Tax=Marinifilum fragile TaxID=570161 RepID=UPI002AAA6BDB|nr:hypothetical protein [Marinifilum fragile]
MRLISIIILSCFILPLSAQVFKIKGQIIDYRSLTPLEGVSVGFNQSNWQKTDKNGRFEIKTNSSNIQDSLKLYNLPYYYNLSIINLPNDSLIIDLGKIPLFEYFIGHDMSTFNYRWYHFRRKRHARKHWKKEAQRRQNYFNKMNAIIDYYRFVFRNTSYKIEDHIIDLSTPTKD